MKNLNNTQTTNSKKINKTQLPEITLKTKGTLIIKEELMNQIDYLHSKVGDIEWSGVLLYKIIAGSINAPATLQIEAYDMYLMDIGTSAYTEYDLEYEDTKVIHELFPISNPFTTVDNPEEMWRKGMIHTHHSMDTFFSSTDMDELHDNTPKHDIYLSLIVNKEGVYSAKTAFLVETSGEYKVVGREEILSSNDKEYLCMIDMDIVKDVENKVSENVTKRYLEVGNKNYNTPTISTYSYAKGSTTNVSSFSTAEFTQKVLGYVTPTDIRPVYGNIDVRLNNIEKMLKAINKIYKKASTIEKSHLIDNAVEHFVSIAKTTKSVNQELTPELVQL